MHGCKENEIRDIMMNYNVYGCATEYLYDGLCRRLISGVARGAEGDIHPRVQGYGGRILEARTIFASQLIQKENMGHLQFREFRCSVQCLL